MDNDFTGTRVIKFAHLQAQVTVFTKLLTVILQLFLSWGALSRKSSPITL